MPVLYVYANRFTPRVRKGEFPTLRDVDVYERVVEKRWNALQEHLAESSYRRTTRMPIKGVDHGLMGVHVERGEMSPDDPFTGFYGLVRYRSGQRVETVRHVSHGSRVSAKLDAPHYMQEEEVLLVTDDSKLAVETHGIMLEDLPVSVVSGNLERIRLGGFVEYVVKGHGVPVMEMIVDLNPIVSNGNNPLITHVYGEGNIGTGNDFLTGTSKN